MALTGKVGGQGYDPVPAAQYVARCIRVIDLGSERSEKWDKMMRKVRIMFEIPELLIEDGDYAGMPRCLSSKFTLSMAPKSHLRPQLESWRGRAFTDPEAEEFDILTLVGVPAIINVIHNVSGGNTYANIASITPLMKGMTCPEAKTVTYGFALTKENFTQEIFDGLHEKTREAIQLTPEYKELMGGAQEDQSAGQQDDPGAGDGDCPF